MRASYHNHSARRLVGRAEARAARGTAGRGKEGEDEGEGRGAEERGGGGRKERERESKVEGTGGVSGGKEQGHAKERRGGGERKGVRNPPGSAKKIASTSGSWAHSPPSPLPLPASMSSPTKERIALLQVPPCIRLVMYH